MVYLGEFKFSWSVILFVCLIFQFGKKLVLKVYEKSLCGEMTWHTAVPRTPFTKLGYACTTSLCLIAYASNIHSSCACPPI